MTLASILLGFFLGVRGKFRRSRELSEFEGDAEEMVDLIETLGDQDPGSQIPLEITVPSGCEIRFDNESVFVYANSNKSHYTGIELAGPTLDSGNYDLALARTEDSTSASDFSFAFSV